MPLLLETLDLHLTDEVARRIAARLQTDEAITRGAIRAAIPLMIGALAREACRSTHGAKTLHEALDRDHDGRVLDEIDDLLRVSAHEGSGLVETASKGLGAQAMPRRTVDGQGIVDHLFGGRADPVAVGISKASGMDVKRVRKLLPLLAPIVMGALGRVRRDEKLDPSGLAMLVDLERKDLEGSAPDTRGALGGFLDHPDGQIAEEVARIGRAVSGSHLLDGILRGGHR